MDESQPPTWESAGSLDDPSLLIDLEDSLLTREAFRPGRGSAVLTGGSQLDRKVLRRWRLHGDEP